MNHLLELTESLSRNAVAATVNGLWLGLALFLLTAGGLALHRNMNATTRFRIWWAALIAIVLLPLAEGVRSYHDTTTSGDGRGSQFAEEISALPSRDHANLPAQVSNADSSDVSQTGVATASSIGQIDALANSNGTRSRLSMGAGRWVVLLIFAWISISLWRIGRIIMAFRHLQNIKSHASTLPDSCESRFAILTRECGLRRPVRLRSSSLARVPMAIGFFRPMVVVPEGLDSRLSDTEFDQVILHELAHLGRRDDWTNLAEQILSAILFFHPAVIAIARKLELQREVACDDWVISMTGKSKPYALCLTKLVELTGVPSHPALAPGAWKTRSQLSTRVDLLLDSKRDSSTSPSHAGIAAALSLIGLVFVLGIASTPLIALAAPEPPENPPAGNRQPDSVSPDDARRQAEEAQRQSEQARKQAEEARRQADQLRQKTMELKQIADESRRQAEQAQGQAREEKLRKAEEASRAAEGAALQALEAQERAMTAQRGQPGAMPNNFRGPGPGTDPRPMSPRGPQQPGNGMERQFAAQEDSRRFEEDRRRNDEVRREMLPPLLEIARSDADAGVRAQALGSISRLRSEQSIEPILEIVLKDSDPQVRQAGIHGIAQFPNDASTHALISIIEKSTDAELKKLSLTMLGSRNSRPAVDKLMSVAKSDSDAELRKMAVAILGDIADGQNHPRSPLGMPGAGSVPTPQPNPGARFSRPMEPAASPRFPNPPGASGLPGVPAVPGNPAAPGEPTPPKPGSR